ncbi:hypothetical protein G9A89_021118 [Geosiphon pyriformis]|nr:hypothetical protein G9A89_021118 [Geosiphon pyriformis]
MNTNHQHFKNSYRKKTVKVSQGFPATEVLSPSILSTPTIQSIKNEAQQQVIPQEEINLITTSQNFDPEFPLKQQIVSLAGISMAFISITGCLFVFIHVYKSWKLNDKVPLPTSLTVPTYIALSRLPIDTSSSMATTAL